MQKSESEEDGGMKILKWLGVAALVALPIAVLFSKAKKQEAQTPDTSDDSEDIFLSELRE